MIRASVGLAGQVDGSAHRLADPSVSGTLRVRRLLPEPGNAKHDQVRLCLLEPVDSQLPALERAGPEVLDQDVGKRDEPEQDLPATSLTEIEREGALVAAGDLPPERDALVPGAQRANGVAASRVLDLDHVGSEVAQQRAGERPGHHVAEVEDANVRQRPGPVGRHQG